MTLVPKNPAILSRARELRKNMTPQERHLWYDFLKDYPVKIYKQRPIESFIADFYCSPAMLVIEVDGGQHFTEQGLAYDRDRSAIFQSYGIQVIRFTNHEIDTQFDSVCSQIMQTIESRILLISKNAAKRPSQSAKG